MRNRHQVPPDMMHREGHNDTSVTKMYNLHIITRRYQARSKIERVSKISVLNSSKCQGQERQGKTEALPQEEGKIWQNLNKVCGLDNVVLVLIS